MMGGGNFLNLPKGVKKKKEIFCNVFLRSGEKGGLIKKVPRVFGNGEKEEGG